MREIKFASIGVICGNLYPVCKKRCSNILGNCSSQQILLFGLKMPEQTFYTSPRAANVDCEIQAGSCSLSCLALILQFYIDQDPVVQNKQCLC